MYKLLAQAEILDEDYYPTWEAFIKSEACNKNQAKLNMLQALLKDACRFSSMAGITLALKAAKENNTSKTMLTVLILGTLLVAMALIIVPKRAMLFASTPPSTSNHSKQD